MCVTLAGGVPKIYYTPQQLLCPSPSSRHSGFITCVESGLIRVWRDDEPETVSGLGRGGFVWLGGLSAGAVVCVPCASR